MTTYLLGLATLPAVVLVGYVVVFIGARVVEWWREAFPVRLRDSRSRTSNAAALLTAGSVISIRLPFGIFLAWRSTVPWDGMTVRLRREMDRLVRDEQD
jgi:hypothetical protein